MKVIKGLCQYLQRLDAHVTACETEHPEGQWTVDCPRQCLDVEVLVPAANNQPSNNMNVSVSSR